MARNNSTAPDTADKPKRFAQLKQTFTMTRKVDPRIGWICLGVFVAVLALFVLVGFLLGHTILWAIPGIASALLAAAVVFGRRAERAAYAQLDGQAGAAGAALDTLKRGWMVTQAVAVNRQQDIVHRVLGRPGIVLVGEGNPARVSQMLVSERKRHARVAYEIPVTEIVVGTGAGQVPLRKLSKHIMKLPRKITPSDITDVNNRLRALNISPVAMPKGPLPKGARLPKGGLPGR